MAWFEARPTASFADRDASRTAALASAVSRFGIVLAKAGMSMSLHLGVAAHEEHHVRSLPDVSCGPAAGGGGAAGEGGGCPPTCLAADGGDPEAAVFRLRRSFAVPLCTAPVPCLLYGHMSELPDFVVGLAGRRVPDSVVAGRRRGRGRLPADLDGLAAAKLAAGPFFLCRIFASCPGGLGRLVSSLNFAHAESGPNSLVAGRPRRLRAKGGGARGEGEGESGSALRCRDWLAEPPARLPLLAGRATAPVLSPAEMASILALPPSMFGLPAGPGADRTFTSMRTDAADPAAPFGRTGEWGP